MPYKPRPYTCRVCQGEFTYAGPGQGPRFCDEHKPTTSRANLARAAKARGEPERAQVIASGRQAILPPKGSADPLATYRMALALRLVDEPAQAAALAGIEAEGPALDALTAAARELGADEGAVLQRLGWACAGFAAIELASRLRELPASSLASSMRGIVDALANLQSSVRPTFGPINVIWDFGPQDDERAE